jgi:hypothetical protein
MVKLSPEKNCFKSKIYKELWRFVWELLRVADSRVAECKVADSKVAEHRVAECKVADSKVAEHRFAECKVADSKVAECRVAEIEVFKIHLFFNTNKKIRPDFHIIMKNQGNFSKNSGMKTNCSGNTDCSISLSGNIFELLIESVLSLDFCNFLVRCKRDWDCQAILRMKDSMPG